MSKKKISDEYEKKKKNLDAMPQGFSWYAIPSGLSSPTLKSSRENVLKEVLIVVTALILLFYLISFFFSLG